MSPKSPIIQLRGDNEVRQAQAYVDALRRREIEKAWHLRGMRPKERAAHKRAVKAVVRKPKKYASERAKLTRDDLLLLLREQRPSQVLDHLYPDRKNVGTWLKFDQRLAESDGSPSEINLSNFSLLDSPQECLDGLARIAEFEAIKTSVRINFKDKYCLDVIPYMLLTEFWSDMLPIFKGGEMDLPMQKVLAAIGIEEDLKVGFQGITDFDDVWAFPLTRRRRPGDSRSRNIFFDVPSRDYASDRFCDALDQWLNRPEFNLELTKSGRGHIKELLGELLENAERHSDGDRRDGAWTVAGFLAKRQEKFIAHIGILSLGDTFAESLERSTRRQRDQLNSYLQDAKRHGARQSDQALLTLAAVQDGVTCVPEADQDGRGGYGLMEMLRLTNMLGATEDVSLRPEVTIVSGTSCIHLKNPYFMSTTPAGDNTARVQWCNPSNSAKLPPDETHVFDLKRGLPGTAISIRFTLDAQYLQQVMKDMSDA